MLDDFIDYFVVIFQLALLALVGVVLTIAIVGGCSYALALTHGKYTCEEFGEAVGLETRYKLWAGCFVVGSDGKVISKDAFERISKNEFSVKLESE